MNLARCRFHIKSNKILANTALKLLVQHIGPGASLTIISELSVLFAFKFKSYSL
jgi:hypothetical protein